MVIMTARDDATWILGSEKKQDETQSLVKSTGLRS
jgi:hypothetical protein